MLPLMASLQYRLFRDDIVDNFRPYVTAGAGPTTLFISPYARITDYGGGTFVSEKIDFFESLKYGKAHTTVGGFVGAGAYFGRDRTNVMGLSVRYYFIPVKNGIEVMQGGFVKEFGGLYITLHFGSAS
jgi:outer membrane protein W